MTIQVYFDHDPFHLPETEVTLFKLAAGALVTNTVIPAACACGLALKKEDDSSPDSPYLRLGMFTVWGEDYWVQRREWKTFVIV